MPRDPDEGWPAQQDLEVELQSLQPQTSREWQKILCAFRDSGPELLLEVEKHEKFMRLSSVYVVARQF